MYGFSHRVLVNVCEFKFGLSGIFVQYGKKKNAFACSLRDQLETLEKKERRGNQGNL